MKRIDVVQSIRSLKGTNHTANPDAAWVAASRSRLLQHIDRTTEEIPTRIFSLVHLWSVLSLIMPQRTVYAVVRPAFIFILCFGLGTAGWITTVSASLESLPGDALYAVKLATEHTQVAVVEAVQGKTASTELRLSFVSRRVDEVNKAVSAPAKNEAEKQVRVNQAVENLKTEVKSVSDTLSAVKQSNPAAAAAVAQVIDRKVDVIQLSLVSTGVTASSTDAAVAIAQLKQESNSIKADVASSTATSTTNTVATSTDPITTTSTTNTSTTTTIAVPVSTSTPAASASSTTAAQEIRKPQPLPELEQPVVPKKELIPERPPELAPDVVDTPTPISIQTWQ